MWWFGLAISFAVSAVFVACLVVVAERCVLRPIYERRLQRLRETEWDAFSPQIVFDLVEIPS